MKKRKISKYILRNVKAAITYRNKYFKMAQANLTQMIDEFASFQTGKVSWETFSAQLQQLLNNLNEARYFGRWSIGWNVTAVPEEVNIRENSIVDHIETIYSYVRSIHRLFQHRGAVVNYEEELKKKNIDLLGYAEDVIENDQDHVFNLLNGLRERVEVFSRSFPELK